MHNPFPAIGRWTSRQPWREIFTRLALPMLSLSALSGVYEFALLYSSPLFAFFTAAGFELVYITLAMAKGLSEDQRKRATYISMGAVACSMVYNTLAGVFHRNQGWLDLASAGWLGIAAEWLLAILHGTPLALVAYLVADLLLHRAEESGVLAKLNDQLADLAQQLAAKGAELAQALADLATVRADLAQLREQHDEARRRDTDQLRELREQLRQKDTALVAWRERAENPPPQVPTKKLILAYVREQMDVRSRTLSDVARDLAIPESTLRTWIDKAASNGHVPVEV